MFNDLEWLEVDGLGGFASGRVDGVRSRRYHAILSPAVSSSNRFVLVNGFEGWVSTDNGRYPISSQRYSPDVVSPDNRGSMGDFTPEPWPSWRIRLPDGCVIIQEIFIPKGITGTVVSWRIEGKTKQAVLEIRPFFSGREIHLLHNENEEFQFSAKKVKGGLKWTPYEGVPSTVIYANGDYRKDPLWYRNFKYEEEHRRGLDSEEDLAAPGVFQWDLSKGEAVAVFLADDLTVSSKELVKRPALDVVADWREIERKRRTSFASSLERSADCFLVKREGGISLIAGYPWFSEWSRDTFVAIRGICMSNGNLEDAESILLEWAGKISEGQIPNRFSNELEYSSADASLWFIVVVFEFLAARELSPQSIDPSVNDQLINVIKLVLKNYIEGNRPGIRVDRDGLLLSEGDGQSLRYVDGRMGDLISRSRVGKPVELEALWLNALRIGSFYDGSLEPLFVKALNSFRTKFWNRVTGCLYDVVDVEGKEGTVDGSIRPNQMLALGGLPFPLLPKQRAKKVLDVIERKLLTPLGLRSLDPSDMNYRGFYRGGIWERGGAYHQGTVWPWLMGSYVEAWVRYHGSGEQNLRMVRQRFLDPLFEHLQCAGIGHISEIADGNPPHQPRGCPFQAGSLGEFIRILRKIEELEKEGDFC